MDDLPHKYNDANEVEDRLELIADTLTQEQDAQWLRGFVAALRDGWVYEF